LFFSPPDGGEKTTGKGCRRLENIAASLWPGRSRTLPRSSHPPDCFSFPSHENDELSDGYISRSSRGRVTTMGTKNTGMFPAEGLDTRIRFSAKEGVQQR
jgi:hypothetical protein